MDSKAHHSKYAFEISAVAFGQGVYFARDASYSDDGTYAVRDATGQKRMYQCLVLTGETTQGVKDMKAPPTRDIGRNIKYDSAVDDVKNPKIFVVFGDQRAYPEYLITYKKWTRVVHAFLYQRERQYCCIGYMLSYIVTYWSESDRQLGNGDFHIVHEIFYPRYSIC